MAIYHIKLYARLNISKYLNVYIYILQIYFKFFVSLVNFNQRKIIIALKHVFFYISDSLF